VQAQTDRPDGQRVLLAALLLLVLVTWLEPPGSGLAEPDETRYAEIPREMLAAGDLVVPRLNGLPYFEKPPLLYWANAAAFRIFGQTPFAARFPTRLAGLGTALLLVFAAGRRRREGLAAGIFLLASPIGFVMARTNLTDGLLTLFFTATLLAAREAIRRRESARPWLALAAWTGAAAAGAFLTKGLIALALPGLILLLWCLATGRLRQLAALVVSPATPVFLVLAAPWFLLVESRHPGFLNFFFVREHLQRFATGAARRPGPIFYFVPVFVVGFLPGVPFFFAALRRWRGFRRDDDGAFFFLLWFLAVFAFFSISKSKLPPYLFPAIPAAALLAARAVDGGRRLWIVQAIFATVLAAAILFHPASRAIVMRPELAAIFAPLLAILVLASFAAVLFAGNSAPLALMAVAAGWAAFFSAVCLGWPRIPQARFPGELAAAARAAAAPGKATIVGYKDYLNGFSFELKTAIPVAGYRGELEPEFETRPEARDAIFWPPEKFWTLWKSDRPVLALVRMQDLVELMTAVPPARVVRWAGRHAVVANFPE
jgi:4-amino-4-deoxy-L-arabinose transferase-like glycosyltransferase